MSKPFMHTFGVAKYVYASAYDALEAERDELKAGRASFFDVHAKMQDRLSDAEADNAKLRETLREAEELIGRYFHETQIGKQPHMIAHKAEAWLKAREGEGGLVMSGYCDGCGNTVCVCAEMKGCAGALLHAATLPVELTNGNDGRGSKWFSSAKIRKEVEAKLRTLGFERSEPFPAPCRVEVTRILGKGQRLWDMSSIGRGNWKEIEDALVVLGWWKDDDPKNIYQVDFRQDATQKSAGPCIEVRVYAAR